MPRNLGSLARSLSLEEIRALLAIKEQLVEAEARRAEIEAELHRMDGEIVKLVRKLKAGSGRRGASARKASRSSKGETASKRRGTTASRARRTAGSTTSAGRGRGRNGKSLEQVVVDLIHSKGGTMQFPDIKSTILRRKLFATRSKNFDNVLRRTISSSEKIKRVARGTYRA